MTQQIKIELLIEIKENGEVILTIPHPIGKISIGSPKSTQLTQISTQSPTTTSGSQKVSSKKSIKSKKAGMIDKIRALIQQNPELGKFLLNNEVDLENLENLTERQLNRAYALAMDYLKKQKPTESEKEVPYF
jgi:predicted ATPase